jgi:hypothetical protein
MQLVVRWRVAPRNPEVDFGIVLGAGELCVEDFRVCEIRVAQISPNQIRLGEVGSS